MLKTRRKLYLGCALAAGQFVSASGWAVIPVGHEVMPTHVGSPTVHEIAPETLHVGTSGGVGEAGGQDIARSAGTGMARPTQTDAARPTRAAPGGVSRPAGPADNTDRPTSVAATSGSTPGSVADTPPTHSFAADGVTRPAVPKTQPGSVSRPPAPELQAGERAVAQKEAVNSAVNSLGLQKAATSVTGEPANKDSEKAGLQGAQSKVNIGSVDKVEFGRVSDELSEKMNVFASAQGKIKKDAENQIKALTSMGKKQKLKMGLGKWEAQLAKQTKASEDAQKYEGNARASAQMLSEWGRDDKNYSRYVIINNNGTAVGVMTTSFDDKNNAIKIETIATDVTTSGNGRHLITHAVNESERVGRNGVLTLTDVSAGQKYGDDPANNFYALHGFKSLPSDNESVDKQSADYKLPDKQSDNQISFEKILIPAQSSTKFEKNDHVLEYKWEKSGKTWAFNKTTSAKDRPGADQQKD